MPSSVGLKYVAKVDLPRLFPLVCYKLEREKEKERKIKQIKTQPFRKYEATFRELTSVKFSTQKGETCLRTE